MPDGPRDLGDWPDGGLSGLLRDFALQCNVGRNHAYIEGYEPADRAVLEGYDRALHPYMHGRRPHDLARKARAWLAERVPWVDGGER